MTLTEARKILEQHLAWCRSCVDDPEPPKPDSNDLYKAIEVAISALPKDTSRPTAKERLNAIRRIILDVEGFDPFETRSRDPRLVCWRQCESGFRPYVRDDWPYDCREMAKSNREAWIRQSGGYVDLTLF